MDPTLWAAIIGGLAAVLTASIGGGTAIFRDRLHIEKTRADRAWDDLEDNTHTLDKVATLLDALEKRLAQVEYNQRLTLELDRRQHGGD